MKDNLTHVEKLSLQDLRHEIRSQLTKLENLGFQINNLPNFVIASLVHRRKTLFFEMIEKKQNDEGKLIDPIKREELAQAFVAEYDGLSADNLTETFRYQYDRATAQESLDREPFPAVETPEYKQVQQVMLSLGMYLKVLRQKSEDSSSIIAFGESLLVLGSTPLRKLQEHSGNVRHQIDIKKPIAQKVKEILFYLDLIQRDIARFKQDGDKFPDSELQHISNVAQIMEQFIDDDNYEAALESIYSDEPGANGKTVLELIIERLSN